jgi:glycosyltransferase involved in cell wall biosynthesis
MHQARALADAGDDVLIISGEESSVDSGGIPVSVIEPLGYDRFRPSGTVPDGTALADAVCKAMEVHWGGAADIVHVHNPLIRKNNALLPALHILNKRGFRLLLQNHDLAEDFRPDVYIPGEEYPENCHYAVINSRDYSFLHRAGLKAEGLHMLPNEVSPVRAAEGLKRTRYLYPVRAIRRKNIGEALFLSLFIPPGTTVAVTLPPTTEKDSPVYRYWVELAGELKLPVEFDAGLSESIEEVYGTSRAIITTSVKEGFGFSFLEPWTAGREVVGRRIDYVCRDFEEGGVIFNAPGAAEDALYSAINIPSVYISTPLFKNKLEHTISGVYHSYGITPPDYIIKTMEEKFLANDVIDFGWLDEELQGGIIRTLLSNRTVLREIAAANPFLAGLADRRSDGGHIESNNRKIRDVYGKERITSILREIYQSMLNAPIRHRLCKSQLLDLYLDPLRFFLVGVGRE